MKNLLFLIFFSTIFYSNVSAQEIDKRVLNNFKKNNVSILPLMLNTGLGFGAQYERYLDKNNNLSFTLPVQFILTSADAYFNGNYSGLSYNYTNNTQFGFSLNPGIRLYFVEPRKFNWYIGMSFLYNYLNINGIYNIYDFSTMNPEYRVYKGLSNNSFSSLVNVGFKGTIRNKVTYQLEFGNGVRYIDKTKLTDEVDGNEDLKFINRINYMGNFLVGFGYIF